ncbi:MAG: c-type cytochrome [Nitrospiraceae bacterium]
MRGIANRSDGRGARRLWRGAAIVGISAVVGAAGCTLFQSEQISKGQALYAHYCMHCHGEHGRQNEGYNWSQMPDPRPKDLSAKEEMSTFKDEEIFDTISRDMKDTTPEVGDKIGDDEFAVPTMPTFKYTLSEEEIWAIVAYVRTLHGLKLEFNAEGRKKELQDQLLAAEQAYDKAAQAFKAAEKTAEAEAEKKGVDVEDSATDKEQAAMAAAKKALDKAQAAMTSFSTRPKFAIIPRADLRTPPAEAQKLVEVGKRLYQNKYGCNACHRVGDAGGVVGPALDRAGFRLNATWVNRWIKYPQSIKPETRMPNLGLSDSDARAVTLYLSTLRAPKPDTSVPTTSN